MPLQNGQFRSKIKNAKNKRKTILQQHLSCSVQETAPKNTKYSRNESILKIGHLAKAIAHAKAIAFAKWPIFKMLSFLEYLVFLGAVFCTEQL